MSYEWDEAKSNANLKKHGLSFGDAEAVFEGDTITTKITEKTTASYVTRHLERYKNALYLSLIRYVPEMFELFQ